MTDAALTDLTDELNADLETMDAQLDQTLDDAVCFTLNKRTWKL